MFTLPTSVWVKPTPRSRKVVDSASENASASLYRMISAIQASTSLRVKNALSGSTTAVSKVRGGAICAALGEARVPSDAISISAAMIW